MKQYLIYSLLILHYFTFSQTPKIAIAKSGTKILIFPSEVEFSELDDPYNFVEVSFTKKSKNFGKFMRGIQFSDLSESTNAKTIYSVVTKDGLVYDLEIYLDSEASNTSMDITTSMANFSIKERIKNTQKVFDEKRQDSILPKEHFYKSPKNITHSQKEDDKKGRKLPVYKALYESDKDEYFRRKCYYNISKEGSIVRHYERNGKVFLWLKEVYYNEEELYLHFQLENNEIIDYDVKVLTTMIATDYKGDSNFEKSLFSPVYRYNIPKRVHGNSSCNFFLVYNKFSLDKNRNLIVNLDETNGKRSISLEIDKTKINKPKKF